MLSVARDVLGDSLEEDAPLMESGLDSLSAVDFRNQARDLAFGRQDEGATIYMGLTNI